MLFVDSADKAARFIWLCDAFKIPLLFLADVPGFMIGKAVERQGIIRHGAKMLSAMADATVPQVCVVLRKAYGAGLYAMCGPGFEPDATIALPQAMIAVMGAEAAVNAVYANKIAEKPEAERAAYVEELRAQYRADIDILKLAGKLHVDAVTPGDELRAELLRRLPPRAPRASRAAAPSAGPAGLASCRPRAAHADSCRRGSAHPGRDAAGRARSGCRCATRRARARAALLAPENLPVERRSVMDGYAVRAADVRTASELSLAVLNVVGTVPMGDIFRGRIAAGEAVAISTGGFVPADADAVVMVEHTSSLGGSGEGSGGGARSRSRARSRPGANVVRRARI